MLAIIARYAVFALVSLVGPGVAAQRLLGLPVDRALVLPLGLVAAAGAQWLALVTGADWLAPLLLGALDLSLLLPALRALPGSAAPGPSLRGALAPLALLIGLLAVTQYPGNRRSASGEFLLDPFLAEDTGFHVGLTRELTLGYPPQAPGLAGQPIGYHLGTDLVRAAALRWAAVDPFDSIARLDVTLFALALLLALRGAAWSAGLRGTALALVGWTLVLTDFSFLFAVNPQAHWWADMLRGNILIALFLASPVVPGLAITLGALIALGRALNGEHRRWIVVASLLAAAVPFFRVFLGAHLLLGLFAALALGGRQRVRTLLAVAAPCALATALLVLGRGGEPLEVGLEPLDVVRTTVTALGLEPMATPLLALWSLAWLAASFGLRLLGIPEALRAIRSGTAPACAMAVMALAGWPLGLLFRVAPPETVPGQKTFNDAYVLIEQAGPILWIFTAAAVARLAGQGRRRLVVLGAGAALALPATAQFVMKKARLPPDPIPAAMVRAMDAVEAHSRPGDVVLQRPGARYPPLPVVLAGRRVVYERFTAYSTQFAPAAELQRRHERVFRFFRTHDRAEAEAIARELGAVLVVLYGTDRLRFDPDGLLTPVYEESQVSVYSIRLGSVRTR